MALTLDQLKKLAEGESLRYFVDPKRDALMLGMQALNGSYRMLIISEVEGQFLQFRSMDYLHCAADHRHLLEVLKVLGALNYKARLVKFGWDAQDGEIVAYADMWVQDGTVTQGQFERMLQNYVASIDAAQLRLRATIETGTDPGEEPPEKMIDRLLGKGSGSLPSQVAEALKKLLGKKDKGGDVTEV